MIRPVTMWYLLPRISWRASNQIIIIMTLRTMYAVWNDKQHVVVTKHRPLHIVKWSQIWINHCGFVTQLVSLGHTYPWFKLWIKAWRHQVIAWTTNEQLSTMTRDSHLKEIFKHFSRYGPLNCDKKMSVLKSQSHLPRAYELIKRLCRYIHCNHHKPVSLYYRTRMSYKLLSNPWARLNIRMSSYQYREYSHYIDTTV